MTKLVVELYMTGINMDIVDDFRFMCVSGMVTHRPSIHDTKIMRIKAHMIETEKMLWRIFSDACAQMSAVDNCIEPRVSK